MARLADPAARAVVQAYQARQQTLRSRTLDTVTAHWLALGTYHKPDVARFAAQVAPVVRGGQTVMVALTAGYLNSLRLIAKPGSKAIHVPTQTVTGPDLRGGLDPQDEWMRPGETLWYQLGQGTPLDGAVQMGLTRALVLAAVDLQLAKTWTSRAVMAKDDHVTGYERVPNGGACDYCLGAAEKTYHSDNLMPIHAHCECDQAPVYGSDRVPSDTLGAGDLPPDAPAFAVEDNGEIGPVLVGAGQHFRDSSDVAADQTS